MYQTKIIDFIDKKDGQLLDRADLAADGLGVTMARLKRGVANNDKCRRRK